MTADVVLYDPDEDDEGLGEAAWELASRSGIRVLSDKDLKAVAIERDGLVGAMFDSLVGGQYSFDVVVDRGAQGRGIGSALIDAALEEFDGLRDAGAELSLDVVNEALVPVLERRGLSVLDREGDHVIMGRANPVDLAGAARRVSADPDPVPELVPGYGFHLEGDGFWDVQELPPDVARDAEFSAYLEIEGFPSAVFEMPDGDQWAQKEPGTSSPKGDEAARDVLSSSALHGAAGRVAGKTSRINLDPGLQRSLQSMSEEMAAAEAALDKAVQHGRRLSVDPNFEWIVQHVQSVLEEFREFRKSAEDAIAYAMPEDES